MGKLKHQQFVFVIWLTMINIMREILVQCIQIHVEGSIPSLLIVNLSSNKTDHITWRVTIDMTRSVLPQSEQYADVVLTDVVLCIMTSRSPLQKIVLITQ